VRGILEEEARATQAYVHETAARLDSELLEEMRGTGIAVNTPDPALFLAASRSVYEEYGRSVSGGDALVARATAAGSR
jgi:TRAP-type C4-dicarboxylate transport system substrate-binding protein